MLVYIARRLLWAPVLLFAASLFVFVLGHYGPGDPVEVRLGTQHYTPEAAARIRAQMGLDKPIPVQYGRYVWSALRGDFGQSYRYQGKSVSSLLGPKLWVSAQLFFAGMLIMFTLGVAIGFYAALRQGTWIDPTIVASALVLYALPVFITAPVLIMLFALWLGWVPTSGWGGFFDKRIILPALTIGLPGIAVFARMMRTSTLDVLGQDFIRTAKAKGLRAWVVNYRHIARNAMIPILTVLGFSFAGMLGGALIAELIFGIPGVASFSLDAIFQRDYPVITALALIGAGSLVIANLIVDVLYAVVDPRIRYS
ncbi:MAG: ABC transporter permease [Chloroflexi bacterium]|nr:ABC transporter permease [Chloroflexota bacterium]